MHIKHARMNREMVSRDKDSKYRFTYAVLDDKFSVKFYFEDQIEEVVHGYGDI